MPAREDTRAFLHVMRSSLNPISLNRAIGIVRLIDRGWENTAISDTFISVGQLRRSVSLFRHSISRRSKIIKSCRKPYLVIIYLEIFSRTLGIIRVSASETERLHVD